jgi:hypothetical protein
MGKRLIEIVAAMSFTLFIYIARLTNGRTTYSLDTILYSIALLYIWKSNISPPSLAQLIDKARALASLSNWLDEFDGFIICRPYINPLLGIKCATKQLPCSGQLDDDWSILIYVYYT